MVAPYSNVSDVLDLFAPSNNAATTDLAGGYLNDFGGTSAACPYAAGIAAVMQSAAKAATGGFLTPVQVRTRLSSAGDLITYEAAGVTKTRPNLAACDIDGDGMPAGWEMNYFGSLENDGSGDQDGDRLTDLEEYRAGTSPINPDTDGDGTSDGDETAAGTDPLDPQSHPAAVPALEPKALLLAGMLLLATGCGMHRKQQRHE
jgi:subtilisin family serine protease